MAGETETPNTETSVTLPDNASVDEVAALMANLSDDDGGEQQQETERAPPENAQTEGDDTTEQGEQQEGEGEQEADVPDAPDFWSAEDKAFWEKVPPELKPLLKKYEEQRVSFVNQQKAEAAKARDAAAAELKKHADLSNANGQWWQENAPKLAQAFANKWQTIDWTKLAQEDPARWAALKQQAEDEGRVLMEANARGQADIQAAQQRQTEAVQAAKAETHTALAAKYPDYFGKAETATKTYDDLGKFLMSKGIPADRINAIHEAPIIEIALGAMRFEAAQKQASTVNRDGTTGKFTAARTPTRVAPGPASRAANRGSDAARQASERFRASGGSDIEAMAEAIRLNNL